MEYSLTANIDGTISTTFGKDQQNKRPGKGENLVYFPNEYISFDIETTGLSPEFDEIIEIAAVKVSGGSIIDTFECLVRPENPIDDYITRLTGISNEMVADAPTIAEVLQSFLLFIGESELIGHNASFDINFIYDNKMRLFNEPFCNNYVDTLRIARKLFPELPHHRLKDIVQKLDIPASNYHRALCDSELTYKCFEAMRQIAGAQYGEDGFKAAFKAIRTKQKLDLHAITSENTVFDESHPLFGKHCVFTGALEKLTRAEAAQLVVSFGGICDNGVTKKTNYLILGNNDYCSSIKDGKSSKHEKAEEYKLNGYDIEIIPENAFYDLISEIMVSSTESNDDNSKEKTPSISLTADIEVNEYEALALDIIQNIISSNGGDSKTLRIERRTKAYLSVIAGECCDFLRLKTTNQVQWFSLDMWGCTLDVSNDLRFSSVTNKNQRHWKIVLNSIEDLQNYSDAIFSSYRSAIKQS